MNNDEEERVALAPKPLQSKARPRKQHYELKCPPPDWSTEDAAALDEFLNNRSFIKMVIGKMDPKEAELHTLKYSH